MTIRTLTDSERGYAGWPSPCAWLKPTLPNLNRSIVLRAHADVGISENPRSSNTGGFIDLYNARAGAPNGSYWCASWATAMWEDCGARLPRTGRASVDVLFDFGLAHHLLFQEPIEGALVLYGKPATAARTTAAWQGKHWAPRPSDHAKPDAEHVGIVTRLAPYLQSAEGNTAFSGFSRNGEAVLWKMVDASRVLGYLHPTPETP